MTVNVIIGKISVIVKEARLVIERNITERVPWLLTIDQKHLWKDISVQCSIFTSIPNYERNLINIHFTIFISNNANLKHLFVVITITETVNDAWWKGIIKVIDSCIDTVFWNFRGNIVIDFVKRFEKKKNV